MLRLRNLILSAMFVTLSAVAAPAQIRIVSPQDDLESILLRGQQFEADRRWGDALGVYEDALRQRPNDPALSPRHELAKVHFDLARRYADASFRRSLATLSEREAQALYGELLLKVQSHYVTQPNWQELVRRGSVSLGVALGEDDFCQANRTAPNPQAAQEFKLSVARFLQTRPIRDRQQAIDAANYISRLAEQHLQVPSTAAMLEYVGGAAASLDEYSAYLTGDQLREVYSQIEGNFVGLGIELKSGEGGLLIVKVITGSPAERGGVRPGDLIVSVDNRDVSQMSTDAAADLLQGPEGSSVELALANGLDVRRLKLARQHVEVPSVDDVKIIDPDYGIGYLKLTCFQKTTSRDLDTALWQLHRQGMKSLVIDVRGNPGGLLTSSVEVADKFLEDGTIVTTRGRSTLENYTYNAHKAGTWRVPLVVLIDGDSASASEIFAGAMRDHRRATVVGTRSYGKGSVQGIFPLTQAGSGIRLTTAKFYSPSGRPIANAGVQPDVVAQQVAKPLADGTILPTANDPVLDAGVEAARNRVALR